MKIAKIASLILSFIFVVCFSAHVGWTEEIHENGISVNVKYVKRNSGFDGYEKKYSVNENGTSTIIVSNAMVSLLVDNDGDEKYPKLTCKLDLDTNKTTDYYAIFYLSFSSYGGDWFTFDDLKTDVYTLEEGYSPSEGLLYLDLYLIGGFDPMGEKVNIKVEVYYPDGSLAATYGPDDDPDLKNIPVESADYDVKKDPFIPSPTPSPTPTPIPVVDEIKLNDLEGDKLILRKGESVTVSVETLSGGEAISDAEIKAETDGAAVSISPSVATTDENGLAEFTITAKKKGNVKVSFTSGDATKILKVKVK